jgi:hypothetical protein
VLAQALVGVVLRLESEHLPCRPDSFGKKDSVEPGRSPYIINAIAMPQLSHKELQRWTFPAQRFQGLDTRFRVDIEACGFSRHGKSMLAATRSEARAVQPSEGASDTQHPCKPCNLVSDSGISKRLH